MRIENLDWQNRVVFVPDSKAQSPAESPKSIETMQRRETLDLSDSFGIDPH